MKASSHVTSVRAGRYVLQTSGYEAFVPVDLRHDVELTYDGELRTLLSNADRDLGRLDAIASLLPNPELFVAMSSRVLWVPSICEDRTASCRTYLLCEDGALTRPLLYLSVYLKAHRSEYYDRLTAVRHHGHWEGWLKFFLKGISATARAATKTAGDIMALRESHRSAVMGSAKALAFLDALYQQPMYSVTRAAAKLNCTFPTAAKLVSDFENRGWLHELTGHERNRLYRYESYLSLFHRDALTDAPAP